MGQARTHRPQFVHFSETALRKRGLKENKAKTAPAGHRFRHQNRGRIMPSNRMLRTRKATKTFVLNRGTEKRAKEKLSRPMCGKSGRKRSRKRFAIINPIGYKTKE